MPLYYSTRNNQPLVSFPEALLAGLAPDGGLYVPQSIPTLPENWREAGSFSELGFWVLQRWLSDDLPAADLRTIIEDALNFPVPTVRLPESEMLGNLVSVLELTHGPTLSFKDFGARTMARLMTYFLRQRKQRLTILVATSGDTGSAVADGFAGQENIEVVLLYPKGQVSPVQEQQLIVQRPGVRAFAVEGTFDDCQRMVKEAFVAPELAHLPLSSANSINIGRLLPQSLYYLWSFLESGYDQVNFCVPSGNLGNLTGGIFAQKGGLPIHRFVVAHNANDFFPTYLLNHVEDYKPSVRTLSNAMDVGVPSNFERLKMLFTPEELSTKLAATSISDDQTRDAMRTIFAETGYIACPHTSVGLEAVRQYRDLTQDETPFIVLSTAHPAKFPEVVSETLRVTPPTAESLEALRARPMTHNTLAPTLDALKDVLL